MPWRTASWTSCPLRTRSSGAPVEVAAHLGSLPSASFSLTKRIIRQPSRDRVVRAMRSVDEEVQEAWMSAPVQEAVRAYVERTLRK